MNDADEIDKIKSAFADVVRALGGDKELNIVYGVNQIEISNKQAKMPNPLAREDFKNLRGIGDKLGIEYAYHDPILFLENAPNDAKSLEIFTALEQARQHVLADKKFEGVGANIAEFYQKEFASSPEGVLKPETFNAPPAGVLRAMLYEIASGRPSGAIYKPHIDYWRSTVAPILQKYFGNIDFANQQEFSKIVQNFLENLNQINDASSHDEDSDRDEDSETPPEQNNQSDDERGTQNNPDGENNEGENPPEHDTKRDDDSDIFRRLSKTDGDLDKLQTLNPFDLIDKDKQDELAEMLSGYRVFCRDFDQIKTAKEIADSPEETHYLRELLDKSLLSFRGLSNKLAHRLERKLRAQQNRHWNFNLDEGILDTSRLTRIITNPGTSLSFKQESEIDFRDTLVSLLIDNSGSMRGRPISIAAMSADILAQVMDRCGVKTEICGFTTATWKGGKSREKWIAEARPLSPGRLNDLLYIIYKHADQSYRNARSGLGMMLKEGLLKENIDGEALQWAAERLLRRPEQRKILMVISDGAPVDDATLSANKNYYLERHLRSVIESIEKRNAIELTAIGIGHDVTRYYRRAVTINNAEALAETMLAELSNLFDEKVIRGKRGK